MDEWLKSHIAFILPCAYACYAVDGELSRTTVEQRRMIVDAAWECCEMLKAAGVPVNDAENTDRYREGTKQRKKPSGWSTGWRRRSLGSGAFRITPCAR